MKYNFNKNKRIVSSFLKEEYFPIALEFSKEELNNKFIEFTYSNSDMLEFFVDSTSNTIKRLSLTMCNHYLFKNSKLSIPTYDEGDIQIFGPEKNNCEIFFANIYIDGVHIKLNSAKSIKYLKCGQLIFGLTSSDILSDIYIIGLNPDEISHVKFELENQ